MTTPFSKRVEILSDLYMEYYVDYEQFIEDNDLGVPLAVLITLGCATASATGIEMINQSFDSFCELLDIDNHGEYEDIDSMIEFANE